MAHICWAELPQKIVSASRWAGETLPNTLSGLSSTENELAVLGECGPALALSHHPPFLRGCSPGDPITTHACSRCKHMRSVSISYERCSKRRSASVSMQMEKNARQMARQRLVAAMLAGQSWQELARAEVLPLKRAMAYRASPCSTYQRGCGFSGRATWTSIETAWRGTSLSGRTVSASSCYAELHSPSGTARAF